MVLSTEPQSKNINSLTDAERKNLAQACYRNSNFFAKYFHADQIEVTCEPYATLMREHIERLLIEKKLLTQTLRLEELHNLLDDEMIAYNFNDGVNKISTYFYETDAAFLTTYYAFFKYLRTEIIREPFYFQATPTIRIHCPKAKNAELYPRYHTDICYGHPEDEVNIWMPLTEVCEGHGFSVMNFQDSDEVMQQFAYDYPLFIENATYNREFSNTCDRLAKPVTTKLGCALLFDPRCVHSGLPMQAHTRVSLDMRIIPVAAYEKLTLEYQGSGRRKILFKIGHCYSEKSSDEL